MSWETTRQALYAAFVSGWAASAYAAVPYYFPKQPLPDLTQVTTSFVKVNVVPTRARQSGLRVAAKAPRRHQGHLDVELFTPRYAGEALSSGMLDVLEEIFCAQTVSGVVFQDFVPLNPITGVDWENRVVQIFFYFD